MRILHRTRRRVGISKVWAVNSTLKPPNKARRAISLPPTALAVMVDAKREEIVVEEVNAMGVQQSSAAKEPDEVLKWSICPCA